MVLEVVRTSPPPQGLFPEATVAPLYDVARLNADTILSTYQEFNRYGVTTLRTAETDLRTSLCSTDVPTVGPRLAASWGKDLFLWADGNGAAAILQPTTMERIRPLLEEPFIMCDFIPGGIKPADIFTHSQNATLIHIGLSTDDAMLQEIKNRAGVDDVVHIRLQGAKNPRDAYMWDQFAATYDSMGATLKIFPVSGDTYQSFQIGNPPPREDSIPLPIRYAEFRHNGGVIGWSFMRDAVTLDHEKMQKRYPKNPLLYFGTTESFTEQVAQFTSYSGIEFTDEQIRIYVNLRFIPSEHQQVVYDYGPHQIVRNPERADTSLYHPSRLERIGLIGQVLTFTQDKDRERRLQHHLRLQELRRNVVFVA